MVRPEVKKRLIILGTIIFLASMSYKLNYDYRFASKLNMPFQAQQIFWKDVSDYGRYFEKATGAYDCQIETSDGIFFSSSPTSAKFTLDLNDQYKAEYFTFFDQTPNDFFHIMILKKGDIGLPTFDVFVSKRNLQIIKDDSKLFPHFWLTSEEQKERDEMTSDEIKTAEKLKKLAVQRFKETQNRYYWKG